MVKHMKIVHLVYPTRALHDAPGTQEAIAFDFAHQMCFVELTYRKQFSAPGIRPGILDIIKIRH
jgi:hypothetical protein